MRRGLGTPRSAIEAKEGTGKDESNPTAHVLPGFLCRHLFARKERARTRRQGTRRPTAHACRGCRCHDARTKGGAPSPQRPTAPPRLRHGSATGARRLRHSPPKCGHMPSAWVAPAPPAGAGGGASGSLSACAFLFGEFAVNITKVVRNKCSFMRKNGCSNTNICSYFSTGREREKKPRSGS